MGRHYVLVKSLYGFTYENLLLIAQSIKINYLRHLLLTVAYSYSGMHPAEISKIIGKSRTTVISYINRWNKNSLLLFVDLKGKRVKKGIVTFDIANDISDLLQNRMPDNEGLSKKNNWSCKLVSEYITKEYGINYSKSSVSLLLKNLGFVFKWGNYHLLHIRKNKKFLKELQGM